MQKSPFHIPEWTIRLLLAVMMPILNEFQRRMLLGTLCIALGHGSRKYLAEITETFERTISRGKVAIEELGCHAHHPTAKNPPRMLPEHVSPAEDGSQLGKIFQLVKISRNNARRYFEVAMQKNS